MAPAGAPALGGTRAVFEWILVGRCVLQRTSAPHEHAPDGLMVIACETSGGYSRHYFDWRGVTRAYAMTPSDREWTLLRESADFSPLARSRRFIGNFTGDR